MISDKTLKELSKKFGLTGNSISTSQKRTLVKNKLVKLGIARQTGKFTITKCWDVPDAKMKDILIQNGIKIDDEIEIDEEKLEKFLGIKLEEEKLVGVKEIHKSISAIDPTVKIHDVKKFAKEHECRFKSTEGAIKLWFTERQ